MPGYPLQLHSALTLADVVTNATLDAAFACLCQQRRAWPAAADVWRFRRHWVAVQAQLRAD
jgi:RNA-directed DNA polymerase